ncbi:phosphoribosyltransferase domain-containing protein [Anaerophilus nitritogenes]|uniref:phosphoribosyltransferase domain-containing protein n=1 Tax=Anaerophilus nitritogenes TaxID=2498136 RepID=UPI00101DF4F7
MKEKTLPTYAIEKIYNMDQEISVKVKINKNIYHIPMEALFLMAARKNKKRSFLFVSKVLGKHIPVTPGASLLTSMLLATCYSKEVYHIHKSYEEEIARGIINQEEAPNIYEKFKKDKINIDESMLFIGFAETATALGHGVFECFEGDIEYIHTTREKILGVDQSIEFEEEHSHSTTHRLYPIEDRLFTSDCPIVFIDDEITTGKTILNMIKEIQKIYPRKQYGVLSILDWRNQENIKKYKYLEKELGIKINTVSLLSGEIEVSGEVKNENDFLQNKKKSSLDINIIKLSENENLFESILLSSENSKQDINNCPYIKETARFGIHEKNNKKLDALCKKIGSDLQKKRIGKSTLCLGTGEFMYIPMKIASYMGEGVKYHSTTRSPIYPLDQDEYGAKNVYSFESFDDPSIINYFYNVSYEEYDDLFIFIEREIPQKKLDSFIESLKYTGILNISFVVCADNYYHIKKPDAMGSYKKEDVIFLLKDISLSMRERGTKDREEAIQSGIHYSEMLPIEYMPSSEYMNLFYSSLNKSSKKIAKAVGIVAQKIINKKGKNTILVSLARAGTPIGILIKRYILHHYGVDLPHYSISIIRGKGIDENAIKYILKNHPNQEIQFIDGWTGKGAIAKVLKDACESFKNKYGVSLDATLAVLADPGHCASIFGTREDFLIPSACLNSTVSGLVSRTVHTKDLIEEDDFHGAKYYKELKEKDVSNFFIDEITKEFIYVEHKIDINIKEESVPTWEGLKNIKNIQKDFGIEDINLIKPGIGETTRVLLRRIPWKILVKEKGHPNLEHIELLAKERNVLVEVYPHMTYECCGIIKTLKGDKNDLCK